MNTSELEKLRYPIGHFQCPVTILPAHIAEWTTILEELPEKLKNLVLPLTAAQLDTPYREGGWSIQQLTHHIADSHHNSYTRFKWALTEKSPIIKVYNEKEWVLMADCNKAPIALSLNYLTALHAKLVYLIKGLSSEDLKKSYVHPEDNSVVTVAENIGKYAWHSQHHFAHIKNALIKNGW